MPNREVGTGFGKAPAPRMRGRDGVEHLPRHQPAQALTDEELAEATRAAVFCLGLEAARLYGLVTGGPGVDVRRCDAVIAEARRRGLPVPTLEEVLGDA